MLNPRTVQLLTIRSAIKFYLTHKVQINTAYTPKAMKGKAEALCDCQCANLAQAQAALERKLDSMNVSYTP